MIELRYNTADQKVTFGQFLDSIDGNTQEAGLTINNTDIKLHKWGTITLVNKNSGGATYISNGVYYATFNATDSNTLGPMPVYIHVAGALAEKVIFSVITQKEWDRKYGSGSDIDTVMTFLMRDKFIDTSGTPWVLESRNKDSKAVLLRQKMQNTGGTDISSTNNVLGQLELE